MIVDEISEIPEIVEERTVGKGVCVTSYRNSVDAIEDLQNRTAENLPKGYFIDMKLIGDLEGSERIYNYLKEKGAKLDNFYFTTRNINRHDAEVLRRTGAKYLLKHPLEDFVEKLEKIVLE